MLRSISSDSQESLINGDQRADFTGWSFYDTNTVVSDFSYAEPICWGAIQTIIMAVMSQTVVEFTCKEKSLEAAVTLAFVVPLSIEWIKFSFNLSGALKNKLEINHRANFLQICLLLIAAIFLYEKVNSKAFSSLGYNSVIIITGICLKHIADYISATSEKDETIVSKYLDSMENKKWLSALAMHGLGRLPLLFCATNAGGQFFEAMHIPLAEGLAACGLTKFGALVAFSVLLNEIIGSHLLVGSGRFQEGLSPNLVSRCITMLGLGISLQATNILQEEGIANFTAAFAIGFFADLLVQETGLGNKIDRTVEQGISHLKAKCCHWQPAPRMMDGGTVYNPIQVQPV